MALLLPARIVTMSHDRGIKPVISILLHIAPWKILQ